MIRRLSAVAQDSADSWEFVEWLLEACSQDWAQAEDRWERANRECFSCVDPAATRRQRFRQAEAMAMQLLMVTEIASGTMFRGRGCTGAGN